MGIDRNRRIVAWSLLLVVASMLAFSALHVHGDVRLGAEECYQCSHHLHHSGHLSEGGISLHDCVLCQFVSTPYIAAVVLAFVPLLYVCVQRQSLSNPSLCRKAWDIVLLRAPPVFRD